MHFGAISELHRYWALVLDSPLCRLVISDFEAVLGAPGRETQTCRRWDLVDRAVSEAACLVSRRAKLG